MTETFDLSLEQAHAYEDLFVPALFAQWVPVLLRTAGVGPGQHVLDVACGTGVVARQAAALVGPSGHLSGVDLNPAMIEVARERASAVDWRVGDAAELPYDDGSFDAVLCQSALFFFPDPARAIGEMARVGRPGGVVALQTYAGLDEQPAYGPFVRAVVRHAGEDARAYLGTYWSRGDFSELRTLLEGAGLEPALPENVLGVVRFPSMDAFVHTEIQGTPLAGRIDEPTFRAIAQDVRATLRTFEDADGGVRLPIRARFVAGRRRVTSAR
ncbi:class I SAM-dependent methyltransferase [Georgenia subflava]|uniref:Methyltransferase domain-containing protein n=1 Tax=Georgenia subflava TaxID=1622177 RepID=A0A6N7EHK1_9MICO|nr:methyltransferase domain-containing protein [Georgenia subflava]MPV35626.1 methyltransferase domain-containing protein [Georgenia subflava]